MKVNIMIKVKLLSILSFISLIFILSSVSPGLATTYYTHYYTALDTSVSSNTNWGSSNAPRYYVAVSYYGLDGKWHDNSRILLVTSKASFTYSLNTYILIGQEALYQIDSTSYPPIRIQFSIGYSYNCFGFTCSSSYYSAWWYLYPNTNPYYFSFTWEYSSGGWSTWTGEIYWKT